MARIEKAQRRGLALSGVAPVGVMLLAGLAALLMMSATACGGGPDSESAATGEGPAGTSSAGSGAEAGSGGVAGNTSPGAPITITTHRSPT
jgi:hypothetical protein